MIEDPAKRAFGLSQTILHRLAQTKIDQNVRGFRPLPIGARIERLGLGKVTARERGRGEVEQRGVVIGLSIENRLVNLGGLGQPTPLLQRHGCLERSLDAHADTLLIGRSAGQKRTMREASCKPDTSRVWAAMVNECLDIATPGINCPIRMAELAGQTTKIGYLYTVGLIFSCKINALSDLRGWPRACDHHSEEP